MEGTASGFTCPKCGMAQLAYVKSYALEPALVLELSCAHCQHEWRIDQGEGIENATLAELAADDLDTEWEAWNASD